MIKEQKRMIEWLDYNLEISMDVNKVEMIADVQNMIENMYSWGLCTRQQYLQMEREIGRIGIKHKVMTKWEIR